MTLILANEQGDCGDTAPGRAAIDLALYYQKWASSLKPCRYACPPPYAIVRLLYARVSPSPDPPNHSRAATMG